MDAVPLRTTLTVAVADMEESFAETACTLAVRVPDTDVGAVYKPYDVTVPVAGDPPGVPLTFQVTDLLLPPVTVALNCCASPGFNVADMGATVTAEGLEDPPQFISGKMKTVKKAAAIGCDNRMAHPAMHLAD